MKKEELVEKYGKIGFLLGNKTVIEFSSRMVVLFVFFLLVSSGELFAQTINAGSDKYICNGDTFQLGSNPTASGSPTSYSWTSYPSGFTSSDSTPIVTPSVTTTYFLAVQYSSTSTLYDTITVTVVQIQADFNISEDTICSGYFTYFSDTSRYVSSNPSYYWTFNNGNTSSAKNPSFQVYNATTTGSGYESFSVNLEVKDSGCTDTKTKSIYVIKKPVLGLFGDSLNTGFKNCSGSSTYDLALRNKTSTSSISSFLINWGNGSSDTASPTTFPQFGTCKHNVYNTQGYFDLEIITYFNTGCTDTFRHEVFNGSNPAISLGSPGNTTGCTPFGLNFTMVYQNSTGVVNQPGTKYEMSSNYGFSDSIWYHPSSGLPDTIYYQLFSKNSCSYTAPTTPNSFYMKLTASNACGVNIATVEPIHINEPLDAEYKISPDTNVCLNSKVTFTDISKKGISINPTSPGSCQSGIIKYWTVSPGTYGTDYEVWNSNSQLGYNDPDSTFYGSDVLELKFKTAGVYSVSLIRENYCGRDTFIDAICVIPPASASFQINNTACAPDTQFLVNTSSSHVSCANEFYTWTVSGSSSCSPFTGTYSFVDSTNFMSANPHIKFSSSGIYKITLKDSNACSVDTISLFDTIYSRPQGYISLNKNYLCKDDTLLLDSIKVNSCYSQFTQNWLYTGNTLQYPNQFNPGYISTDSTGVFVLSLVISNSCGSDTLSDSIFIFSNPILTLSSIDDICVDHAPIKLSFGSPTGGNYSSSATGLIASDTLFPQYGGVGTHNIRYTYSDSFSCTSEDSTQITILPLPNTFAGIDTSICYQDSFHLNPTVESNHTYYWFANGVYLSSQADLKVSPSSTTTYVLVDSNLITGCTNIDSVQITVNQLPQAIAGSDSSICLYDSIQLGQSVTNNNSYSWQSSPSGFSGNVSNPNVSPAINTLYFLTVTDSNYCSKRDTVLVVVDSLPIVSVSNNDTICLYDSISIIGASFSGYSYSWSSSSGGFNSTISNPVVSPSSDVTFYLIVSIDSTGCQNIDSIKIKVNQLPNPNLQDTSMCYGDTIEVSVLPSNYISYNWSPSTNISSTSLPATLIYCDTSTLYTITVVDSNNCSNTDSTLITVYSMPNTAFTIDSVGCGPITHTPDNATDPTSTFNHNYLWSVSPNSGVSFTSTAYEPGISFPVNSTSSVISYTVKLVATSTQGCKDSADNSTIIYPKPLADFSFVLSDSCSPDSVTFTNTSTPYNGESINTMSFAWNFGSTAKDPTHIFTNTGVVDSIYWVELIALSSHGCLDTANKSLTIHPDAKAVFTPSLGADCAPLTITNSIINLTQYTDANDTYSWTVFDADSSTVLTSFTGTSFTNYTIAGDDDTVYVRLITSNNFGCAEDTLVKRFVTFKNPVASFSRSDTTGCGNTSITLTEYTTPSGLSLEWDFGDGSTSTSTNPTHTFTNTSHTSDSTYTIQLIAKTSTGCADTVMHAVRLLPIPLAAYSLSDTATCAPASITATNGSTFKGSSAAYAWSANYPSVSINTTTSANPSLGFPDSESGVDTVYVLELITTSTDGCKDSASKNVTIYSRPNTAFTIDSVGCGPITHTPDNTTDPTSTFNHNYLWSVSPNSGVSFTSTAYEPGISFPVNSTSSVISYAVKLVVTSAQGCKDSADNSTIIYPKPLADFSFVLSDSCSPDSVTFTNTSTPYNGESINTMSFAWNFGSTAKDPTHIFTNTGVVDSIYWVELIALSSHGCLDTANKSLTIHPDAKAVFTPSLGADCAPLTITNSIINLTQYTDANDTYSWTVFDADSSTVLTSFTGTSFTNYTIAGDDDTVYVRLITSNNFGCAEDTLVKRFVTFKNPVASFSRSDTTGCGNTSITLTEYTTPSGLSLEWDFGDGSTSTSTNPTHTFTNTSHTSDSTYTIQLIAKTSTGCADTIEKQVTAFGKPLANFGFISVCEDKVTNFTDSSLAGGASIINRNWNFDDGNIDSVKNPNHIYIQDGVYSVKLKIQNGHNCLDSIVKTVNSHPIPIISYAHDSVVCVYDSIAITNMTSGAIYHNWKFGNGQVDTRYSPKAYYPVNGVYSISYVATTVHNCVDSAFSQIKLITKPTSLFIGASNGCAPLELHFTNKSKGDSTDYSWDYGQGLTSFGFLSDTILYTQGRSDTTYFVSLIAENECGLDTFTDSFTVYPTPFAFFETNVKMGCSPLLVELSNNNTFGNPDTLIWDFGDGSPLFKTTKSTFEESLFHTFSTDKYPKTHTISYIAKNNCGADTAYKSVSVYNTVEAFFNADTLSGCYPLTVNFTNSSIGYLGWAWDFDDGNTSNLNNPSHTFAKGGTYEVTLFVTDSCSYDTFKTVIEVFDEPQLGFEISKDSVCLYDTIHFSSTSNEIAGVYWNFGDSTKSVLANPSHSYDVPGTYIVSYNAFSKLENCPSTISKDIIVLPRPESEVFANPMIGCTPLRVDFSGDSSYHSWVFSNGNTSGLKDPTEIFTSPGTHFAKLISEYANGCYDSSSISIIVHPQPTANFTASKDSTCILPTTISFSNESTGAIGYDWYFGNGLHRTDKDPSIKFELADIYKNLLVASNQFGCVDSFYKFTKTYNPPEPKASVLNEEGCVPLYFELKNDSKFSTSYKWFFGDGDSSFNNQPSHIYDSIGSYKISLIAFGNANCVDTVYLDKLVDVYPSPIADFDYVLDKVKIQLNNKSVFADTYNWDFGDRSNSTEINPNHRYEITGDYDLTLIAANNYGCFDTAYQRIELDAIYNLFVSNAFSPEFGPPEVRKFQPRGIGIMEYHIYIFDTWGNLIWESDKLLNTEPAEGWNGNDRSGKPMPQDTYVWKVSATFLNGQIWPGKVYPNNTVQRYGTVTLIR